MTGKFRLTDIVLEEISTVVSGDDPEAMIVFSKSEETVEKCGRNHDKMAKGKACTSCGYIAKGMPDSKDVQVPGELDELSFKHKKSMKRKKRKQMLEEAGIIKSRDGDGDGFYSPRRGMPDKTPVMRRGRPVIPNPLGPGAKPNPAQADIDATIAAAEGAAALSRKRYDTPEAATADLSTSWERVGGTAVAIRNKKTGQTMHLSGGGSNGFHWKVAT